MQDITEQLSAEMAHRVDDRGLLNLLAQAQREIFVLRSRNEASERCLRTFIDDLWMLRDVAKKP